ncbi:MAG: hypothetical protein U9O87_03080 [Verrucomicrobiota bacterium]|nr:hypothetical protein [Verrucomicrobiota bacterium]
MIFIQICKLLISLLLPTLAGNVVLDNFSYFTTKTIIQQWLTAFSLGIVVFTSIWFFMGICGFPIDLFSGTLICLFIWSFAKITKKILSKKNATISVKKREKYAYIFILIITLIYFIFLVIFSLSKPVPSAPGIGVWGYKAKVLFHEESITSSLFDSKVPSYTHPSYPFGYPLLLAWNYLWMGKCNDHLIKLIPVIFTIAIFLQFYLFCREQKVSSSLSLWFPLMFCGSYIYVFTAGRLYAEPFFIFCVLQGTVFILEYLEDADPKKNILLFLGVMLLGASAWIKNEGLVFFCISIFYFFLMGKKIENKRRFYFSLVFIVLFTSLLFVFPWLIFRFLQKIRIYDFDKTLFLAKESFENIDVLYECLNTVFKNMFLKIKGNNAVWYFLLFSFLFFKKQSSGSKWLLVTLLSYCFCLTFIYIFSIRSLDWHLRAMQRTFLLPEILAWLYILKKMPKVIPDRT